VAGILLTQLAQASGIILGERQWHLIQKENTLPDGEIGVAPMTH
jgi:hypothetical protein